MPSLTQRDRRALLLLAGAVVVVLVLQFGLPSRAEPEVAVSSSIPAAELRLRRLQEVARQKPGAAAESEAAARALAETEKGLLRGTTPAQASAEMQPLMKELLRAQGINMQSSEFMAVKPVGEDYAQVPLALSFNCAIEQWVNLMAAIRNAPQVLSTLDLRLGIADPKNKLIQVRMIVAGYIPASLVAPAKGVAGI